MMVEIKDYDADCKYMFLQQLLIKVLIEIKFGLGNFLFFFIESIVGFSIECTFYIIYVNAGVAF